MKKIGEQTIVFEKNIFPCQYIMANAWLAHVKATMKKHKGMKFKQVLKEAKKTYKSSPKSHKAHKGQKKKTRKNRKGKKRSKRR